MPCGFVLPQGIYRKLLEAESVPAAHEEFPKNGLI